MFFKISSSVGSGKTQAVLEHVRDNLGQRGYLFVAPTIALCTEIYIRMMEVLTDHPEYVKGYAIKLVVSDENDTEGAFQRASDACKEMGDLHPIVIVTTKTFEFLLNNLDDAYKRRFAVFVDEGLPSIKQVAFSTDRKEQFLEYLSFDEDHLAVPAAGEKEVLEWVAFSPKKLAGRQLDHLAVPEFQEICALVLSDQYDAYLWSDGKQIEVLGVLSPEPMQAFQSVTLIVAIFERTLLPRLWRQRYDVEFDDYPLGVELYDAHKAKGPIMSIWHALHEGDLPSISNLTRNAETGQKGETNEENMVIYEAAKQINAQFSDGVYCWAANKRFKRLAKVMEGVRMPANSSGLNEFRLHNVVVSLVCINPAPWVKTKMKELFKLDGNELYDLWRFSHTYQAVGRCSLRIRERDQPITVVVPSSYCANQLAKLFEGATVKGQITNLPRYSAETKEEQVARGERIAYTTADNTAYSKYRRRVTDKGEEPLEKDDWYEEIRRARINR